MASACRSASLRSVPAQSRLSLQAVSSASLADLGSGGHLEKHSGERCTKRCQRKRLCSSQPLASGAAPGFPPRGTLQAGGPGLSRLPAQRAAGSLARRCQQRLGRQGVKRGRTRRRRQETLGPWGRGEGDNHSHVECCGKRTMILGAWSLGVVSCLPGVPM